MNEPSDRSDAGRSWRGPVEYAARSKEGLLAGIRDARAGRLHVPAEAEHARRLLFGFAAPFTLLRVAWRDSPTRASLVSRVWVPLALMIAAFGIGVFLLVTDLVDARRRPEALAAAIESDDDDDERPAKTMKEEEQRRAAQAVMQAAQAARSANKSVLEVASAAAAAASAQQQRLNDAAAKDAPPPPKPARSELLRTLARFVESRLAKIVAALGVLEWILVWIVREHHDVVAAQIAQLTGVPSEAPPSPPRLRFDFAWLKTKAWRAIRFLLFVAFGSPPASLLGAIPHVGGVLGAAWGAIWTAYWACVFAVANSHLAWRPPPSPDWAPWFMRALRAAGRVPIVGLPFKLYGAILGWLTRAVWPTCAAFEMAPWESVGLALARLVAGIPGVYVVCHPIFPPAATHAIVARSASE